MADKMPMRRPVESIERDSHSQDEQALIEWIEELEGRIDQVATALERLAWDTNNHSHHGCPIKTCHACFPGDEVADLRHNACILRGES